MSTGKLDLAVRGGRLVTPNGIVDGDLYVHNGRIVALGQLDVDVKETVDARGLLVFPGGIDAHVHFMDPADTSREDFICGSAAAAVAGVTTVLEHTHGRPVHSGADLREKVEHLRNRSIVDFGLGAHFSPRDPAEVLEVWREGAAFIKVFTCTTHGIDATPNGIFFKAMRAFAADKPLFLVHAEDESLTEVAEADLKAAGREDGGVIPEWRSLLAEQVAVAAVVRMALAARAKVVIAHCSHPSIVDQVVEFRNKGATIWAESCPQYLFLYEKEVLTEGPFRKFTPPARARTRADLDAMFERVESGAVAYIGSDHAPSTPEQKRHGSIWECHFGLPGIDTTFPLLLDAALQGRLSLTRLAEVYAARPAALYGLAPRKGALRVGADADFALIDPEARWRIDRARLHSKAGWTPFQGRPVRGRVVATYLRGQKIAEDGKPVAEPGTGRFIPGPGRKEG